MIPPAPSCTVRACGLPLAREAARFACGRGHAFDIAREGYVSLLQPQDRRAAQPGDARRTVHARRRFLATGAGDALARTIGGLVDAHAPDGPLRALDVGCGDGHFLRALAAHRELAACGVDLARDAAALAARAQPEALVVVANADRSLPWPDASFDVALSVTSRRPVAELRRVLAPGGALVVAVPAADDLAELREAVLGSAEARDRLGDLRREMAPAFVEAAHERACARLALDPDALRDALAATYRGARASQQQRAASLEPMLVTVAHDVLAFRPRPTGASA